MGGNGGQRGKYQQHMSQTLSKMTQNSLRNNFSLYLFFQVVGSSMETSIVILAQTQCPKGNINSSNRNSIKITNSNHWRIRIVVIPSRLVATVIMEEEREEEA